MTLHKIPHDTTSFSPNTVVLAILALAIGGFGIGTTEFAMMGLLPNVAASSPGFPTAPSLVWQQSWRPPSWRPPNVAGPSRWS